MLRRTMFGRVRALGRPDWQRVRDHLEEGEVPVDAGNGWFVGDDGIDHPCTVFLTDGSVHVDVRPDASILAKPHVISISPSAVEKAGVGRSDLGNPRFVVVFDVGDSHEPDVWGIAVDFEPGDRRFCDQLASWSATTSNKAGSPEDRMSRSSDPSSEPEPSQQRELDDDPGLSPPPPEQPWRFEPRSSPPVLTSRSLAIIGFALIAVAVINVPSIFMSDPIDPAASFLGGTVPFWAGVISLIAAWRRR